jgi:hypothetical protein
MLSYIDHRIAVTKLVGFYSHTLSHQKQQIAHVGIRICGTTAQGIVFTGLVELVALKMSLIEIQVATVLEAELGSTSEYEREIGVAMAMPVAHAATEKSHRRTKEGLAVKVFGLLKPR